MEKCNEIEKSKGNYEGNSWPEMAYKKTVKKERENNSHDGCKSWSFTVYAKNSKVCVFKTAGKDEQPNTRITTIKYEEHGDKWKKTSSSTFTQNK